MQRRSLSPLPRRFRGTATPAPEAPRRKCGYAGRAADRRAPHVMLSGRPYRARATITRMTESSGGLSTFRDLSALVACPRVNSLALSVDGTRLVAAVQVLSGDGTRFVSGLWEIDPTGERDALRLTRSDKGESGPVFGPDGTLYYLSERAAADGDEDEGAALW